MTSNALSKRRGLLKRPPVCKASPVAPPSSCVCTLTAVQSAPFYTNTPITLILQACNPRYSDDSIITPTLHADIGTFAPPVPIVNCVGDDRTGWDTGPTPGDGRLAFSLLWPDGLTCSAQLPVTVEEAP